MDVVVVESPAKAKTLNKYLGAGYKVVASYGHVRDLPAKDGSVRPDEDFAVTWQVDPDSEKHIREIAKALKDADHLYLATDPDREGEAISWHVREVLKQRKAIDAVDVKRVVFYEITKDAVLDAMQHPREVNRELVQAYLARRALDYLVGFTLSPVLWRKLPGSRSAGRVQSVALRLICEREAEIEAFTPREYWTVDVEFRTDKGETFRARLTHLDGRKLDKLGLRNEASAKGAAEEIARRDFAVTGIERKTVRRNPQPPFITSTLQQDASRKLGFGASRTMRIAQRLYEGVDMDGDTVGLITYMRTDNVNLSREAIRACRDMIRNEYGQDYLPRSPRVYKSTAKNAQEAHEAIRPTDLRRRPDDVARFLDQDQLKLYDLIWKRTLASETESARLEQMAVTVGSNDRNVTLRATGSTLLFDGFLRIYQEGRDEPENEGEERLLPRLEEGERLDRGEVAPEQHFTQPPPRYTEASLVKKLEELGIGRPSTYATIIQVLQDRDYVRLEKRRFIPEDRGRLVTAFLSSFFERYVEYDFTASLEARLDDISAGRLDWKDLLRDFWQPFIEAVDETKGLTISDVLEALNEELGPHFFPDDGSGRDPRACPSCDRGRLSIKLGKFGAFIGCSNYPHCTYTRRLAANGEDAAEGEPDERLLGVHPRTGQSVYLRRGPYGYYAQLGEADDKPKPKRVSLPRNRTPAEVDLRTALALLELPREIGRHPETGKPIVAGIGRYGPYLQHDDAYTRLPKDEDILSVGINRAVELIAQRGARRRTRAKSLGDHPQDGKPVTLHSGRYGPYVAHGKTRASLPKNMAPEAVTLEDAVRLIAEKASRAKGGKRKSGAKTKAKADAAAD